MNNCLDKSKIQIFLRGIIIKKSVFFSVRQITIFITRAIILYDDVTACLPIFFLTLRRILTDATNGPFS